MNKDQIQLKIKPNNSINIVKHTLMNFAQQTNLYIFQFLLTFVFALIKFMDLPNFAAKDAKLKELRDCDRQMHRTNENLKTYKGVPL